MKKFCYTNYRKKERENKKIKNIKKVLTNSKRFDII